MGNNKWVHMLFVVSGLVLAYLLVQTIAWVWGYFGRPHELYVNAAGMLLASGLTLYAWRRPNLFEKASEIINELTKVTWPTRKETSAATVVVIITTIISSLFLGLFDLIWSWATAVVYS